MGEEVTLEERLDAAHHAHTEAWVAAKDGSTTEAWEDGYISALNHVYDMIGIEASV